MFRRKRDTHDFNDEIEAHIQLEAERLREQGLSDADARAAARRKFGNVMHAQERFYESASWAWWAHFWQDVHYGLRLLAKNPGFAIVAVLTLALGIGANTAIFTVIESVMLRPLPFTASDRVVRIYSTKGGALLAPNGSGMYGGPSAPDMWDFAHSNHTFEQMAVYDTWRKNVSFGGGQSEPEQMNVGLVPADYFQILDIKPIVGRLFTEEESYRSRNSVAAISERLWKNDYASDPAILGKTIRINDEPYTIVAVMPDVIPEWLEGRSVQVWTPFGFADAHGDTWTEAGRDGRGWYTLGRIKSSVSFEKAQADLSTIAAGLAAAHPVDRGIGVEIQRLAETRAHALRPMLFLLLGAVTLILMIACVNLANLLLARNSVRARELAMRAALGAPRGRLVRQLLAETLLLSVLGGGAGLILAQLGVEGLAAIRPADLPQLSTTGVDWRILIFTVLVSLGTTFLFGLGPALAGARLNLVDALKLGSGSSTVGTRTHRVRGALVVLEMAMSLMLLVGASLLVQSVTRLQRQALGIREDHLLTGHFYLPSVHYANAGAITRFSDQFADRVRSLPGVVDATITTIYPPNYTWSQMLEIPGHPATRAQDVPSAKFGLTDTHYLKTMGIPLIQGRDFNDSDSATSPAVALISQTLEREYFAGENPVGQRVHIGPPAFLHVPAGSNITDSSDVTIVGVIGDIRNSGLASAPEPQITVLYSQHPLVNYSFKDIAVRTASDPHQLIAEIARQLHQMDPNLPFAQVRTIDEIIDQQTGSQRFATVLLGLFAVAGLALAAVGIYGVVSFLVAQRTRELAVRIAVGAGVKNVLWLVLNEGIRKAAIGAAIGLAGAWAAQRLIGGLLFGISPVDPMTFAGATLFLLAVVVAACWVPAWRAAQVDPCVALRAD